MPQMYPWCTAWRACFCLASQGTLTVQTGIKCLGALKKTKERGKAWLYKTEEKYRMWRLSHRTKGEKWNIPTSFSVYYLRGWFCLTSRIALTELVGIVWCGQTKIKEKEMVVCCGQHVYKIGTSQKTQGFSTGKDWEKQRMSPISWPLV